MFLTIKTDNPVAEVGLYKASERLSYYPWRADRQLAKDLLRVIHEQLEAQQADWPDIKGVAVYQGPGSFTGLRIGITVANALAYGRDIPVVTANGEDWIDEALERLQKGENDRIALPHYGADAHITAPRK